MVIFIHVLIAFLGLAQASYGLIAPSKRKIKATYTLTAATIGSGTYWSGICTHPFYKRVSAA